MGVLDFFDKNLLYIYSHYWSIDCWQDISNNSYLPLLPPRTQIRIRLCNCLNTLESVTLGSKQPSTWINSFQEEFIFAHGFQALCPQSPWCWAHGEAIRIAGAWAAYLTVAEKDTALETEKALWTRYGPQRTTPCSLQIGPPLINIARISQNKTSKHLACEPVGDIS